MSGNRNEADFITQSFYFFCAVAEQTGKFHAVVAEFLYLFQRPLKILFHCVANGIELQSDWQRHDKIILSESGIFGGEKHSEIPAKSHFLHCIALGRNFNRFPEKTQFVAVKYCFLAECQ